MLDRTAAKGKPKKVFLWDVDHTLINCEGAGLRAIAQALRQRFGKFINIEEIQTSGQTEGRIALQCFRALEIEASEHHLSDFFAIYLERLEIELKKQTTKLLAGARELVHRIERSDQAIQGLLTGNLRAGARLKLERVNLWKPFPFGAFADHSDDRNELARHAVQFASAELGENPSPENVYIIGDTPRDIECAKSIGAHSVAVATGQFTGSQLAECEPDHLFDDLVAAKPLFSRFV